MDRPQFEVADVFRCYGADYRLQNGASMSNAQHRVMTAIEVCRTAVLGGHLEQCDQCGHQRNAFNSCANRHCPKCQSLARAQWLQDRQAELLNTQYFHVVFTVPEQIATISYQNKRELFGILFRAAAEALRTIAADPKHLGAEVGFLPCSILGALTCSIIPICIVWSPAVVSLRMARSGFPAELDFSCRSGSSPGYFVVCSWNI
jgi:hypothetical protein